MYTQQTLTGGDVSHASRSRGADLGVLIAAALGCGLVYAGRWGIERLWNPERFLAEALERQWQDYIWQVRVWACGLALPVMVLARRRVSALGGSPALVFFFLTMGAYAMTAAWSEAEHDAALKLADLSLLLISCLLVVTFSGDEDFFRLFWIASSVALGTILLLGLLSLVGIASTADSDWQTRTQGTRLSVAAGGPNVFARQIGLLSLICLGAYTVATRRVMRIVTLAGTFCCVALVVASGSRGGLLATMVGLMVYVGLTGVRTVVKLTAGIVAGMAVTFALYVALGGGGLDAIVAAADRSEFFSGLLDRWLIATLGERYVSERDILLDVAYDQWMEHPVLGAGLAAFPLGYPHNLFLEVAAEGGAICLLLLLAFGIACVLSVHGRTPYARLAIGCAALSLVAAQFSGDIYDSRNVFIFGLMAVAATKLRI